MKMPSLPALYAARVQCRAITSRHQVLRLVNSCDYPYQLSWIICPCVALRMRSSAAGCTLRQYLSSAVNCWVRVVRYWLRLSRLQLESGDICSNYEFHDNISSNNVSSQDNFQSALHRINDTTEMKPRGVGRPVWAGANRVITICIPVIDTATVLDAQALGPPQATVTSPVSI
ncbi:hypothetical protein J6590_003160 [Homalodisca vitripennis]|nr:hypothetical protein J6590_003160 [Homalodisca vitripennis]